MSNLNALYDKVPLKVLRNLRSEYLKLVRGYTIYVPMTVQFQIPVKIHWEEDVHGCFYYSDDFLQKMENAIFKEADELVNEKSKKKLKRLNTLIQRFMLKTKMTATKYDVSDDDIWDYLWHEQNKARL
jgi:hypothetical protein